MILYGDQDALDQSGQRSRPWFKPRWNREMFFAQDYLSSAIGDRHGLGAGCRPASGNVEELAIEASWTDRQIVHCRTSLCHVAARNEEPKTRVPILSGSCSRSARRAPKDHSALSRSNGRFRKLPLVSIIVPTKDKVDLLRPCVDSVLTRTDYEPFEILIVDNASVEKRTADYLRRPKDNPKSACFPILAPTTSRQSTIRCPEARGDSSLPT